MSQFNVGSVKVLAADPNRWVLQGALTTGNIFAGNLVKFDGEANLWFTVATIIDAVTFETVENYNGAKPFDTFLPYVVTRDFTPNLAIPEATQGDRNTADIYTRGMRRIDQLAGPQIARLTNASGGVLVAGDVVGISTAADQAVVLADTAASLRAYAVCLDASVAASASGLFVLGGVILAKAQGAIARGRYVRKSATTKALEDAGVTMTDGAAPPVGTIGVSLAAAASGFCSVLLFGSAQLSRPYYLATLTSGDSAAVVNTTTPTPFNKSHTLPAGILNVAGAQLVVRLFGNITDTGTPNFGISVRLGGQAFFQFLVPIPTLAGTRTWGIYASAAVRAIGGSGVVKPGPAIVVIVEGTPVFQGNSATGTITVDLTSALTLDAVCTWGTASPSNSAILTGFEIEVLPIVGATF